jgi:superfamily II DNA/RNA helicase
MIFCETKREADELALNPDIRQETHVIHGDIPQAKRDMVLSVSSIRLPTIGRLQFFFLLL